MGSYYYLAAQLPSLTYGQTPPMTSETFRQLAKPLLEEEDSRLFDLLDLDPAFQKNSSFPTDDNIPSYQNNADQCGSDFIDNWRVWERTLRLNLARYRTQKTKRDGSNPQEPPLFPADAVTAALRAVNTESPLEAELILDKARWDAVEMFQGEDYFSRNTVYAYLLKLMLLERKACFMIEEGFAEYKSLYASILEGVEPGMLPGGEPK